MVSPDALRILQLPEPDAECVFPDLAQGLVIISDAVPVLAGGDAEVLDLVGPLVPSATAQEVRAVLEVGRVHPF